MPLPVSLSSLGISQELAADVVLVFGTSGEPWISLKKLAYRGQEIDGEVVLAQELHQIRTYRSSFSLATVAVQSDYRFGGLANLPLLEVTAGREALTTGSIQFLQSLVTEVERFVSERLAACEMSDSNTRFMAWVQRHGRYDLCGHLKVRFEPDNRNVSLEGLKDLSSGGALNVFAGSDQDAIDSFATEEKPLVVLSVRQPRRGCEETYLHKYCNITEVADKPTVLTVKPESAWSLGESALAFRLVSTLESDYFVQASVELGKITHNLPLLVNASRQPIIIAVDSESSTISPILELYKTDYPALAGLIKDFVRTAIFPKIANLVPSSRKGGAEAFLKAIRRPRDVFEYEQTDLGSLTNMWLNFLDGTITLTGAARQSTNIVRSTVQVLEPSSAVPVASVLSDAVENQRIIDQLQQVGAEDDPLVALPPVTRLETESESKVLVAKEGEAPFNGYRCFIAITDRVRRDQGEFFLQPHRTEIVWGGQKCLFIFQHHSGEFGLYYELQGSDRLASKPGGQAFRTSTIVLNNKIFIPVPVID